MLQNQGLIYTNENCIGCNRCISGCPVLGANVSITREGKNHIHVDDDKCLHCGRCLETCHHHARVYRDDTDAFFQDLQHGMSISMLVAPSFFIVHEKNAHQILGYLKEQGVQLFFDVGFGADISTWAYLKYVEEHDCEGAIAPPCSVVVNYIQKYSKVLLDQLIPIHSPLLCLASYVRKYLKVHDRLAFLSPCIAKKDEIDDLSNDRLVQYNVTFNRLLERIEGMDLSSYHADLEIVPFGLGKVYPTPGGLSEYMRYFIPQDKPIREIHGERYVYDYFNRLEQRITDGQQLPYIIDCLNCRQGCLAGTATISHCKFDDDMFFKVNECRIPSPDVPNEQNPFDETVSHDERKARLMEHFKDLKIKDFVHTYNESCYQDESPIYQYDPDYADELNDIFCAMHKFSIESRTIDCHSCGYSACLEMATAISKGYNTIENCVHYVKDENIRLSMIDARTGIPNFNAFLNFTEKLIISEEITDYTALFFNINNFKFINQKYGFKQGDLALKEYARTVSELVGIDEQVATIGGNDFIGIFKSSHIKPVLTALESIPLYVLNPDSKEPVSVSARMSIYVPDGTDTSPQMLVEKLSITYNSIDNHSSEAIRYYTKELREKILQEDIMINAIKPALANHEFEVYYQPKVDMQTRELVGAEALIRWNRNGIIVPPMDFIPICETMGLVQKIDFYVLDEVCRHIKEWLEQDIRIVPISVNFSKLHFIERTIAERINEVAEKWQIPKEYLEIEFTETAYLADSQNLIDSIDKLHDFGISSSMDDFGTGYSSLSMLQNMRFNTLKLDKSFLRSNYKDEHCHAVVEHIIKMAKELHMSIVSEGIETREELNFMKNLSCDTAQGYLFDKPLPRKDFEQRLKRRVYPEL